jgi:N-acetylated-alpha-linked acidic dipeptidase
VTLLSEVPFHAKLREDIVEGDPGSIHRDALPVFHGLSVSGDVTGKYVYVGYGRKRDFDALVALGGSLVKLYRIQLTPGVDFNDKIVLVKYGGVFRGLKIKGTFTLVQGCRESDE